MPVYTFNFTSTNVLGEAKVITQSILLPDRPPRGARFYLRQVSATSTSQYSSSFRFVSVYIPELMGTTEQVKFLEYNVDVNGNAVSVPPTPGLRYYLNDIGAISPLTLNVFPNLSLGRHHLSSHYLTLVFTPFASSTTLGNVYSFSVVIEWDTE